MTLSTNTSGLQVGAQEQSTLRADNGSPVTLRAILRELEALRRRLALQRCGTPGAFTGYDTLKVVPEIGEVRGDVTLTAQITQTWPRNHRVTLVASAVPATGQPGSVDLVRGSGRTLQLPLGTAAEAGREGRSA